MGVERRVDLVGNNSAPTTIYGPSDPLAFSKKGSKVAGEGSKNQFNCEWTFQMSDLPTTSEVDVQIIKLEPNAVIKSVDVFILKALSGGTDFTVGMAQLDGTAIDADGILTTNTTTAVNSFIPGDGGLINETSTSLGNNESQLVATTDHTAGVVKVVVEYVRVGV